MRVGETAIRTRILVTSQVNLISNAKIHRRRRDCHTMALMNYLMAENDDDKIEGNDEESS